MLRPRSRRRPPSPRPRAASEESLQGALGLAFRYLGRCDRTVAEMREHLGLRGVDEPTIERVLATLARSGYLDDTRYARRYAEDRRQLDGWGSERIEGGLLRVGIDPRARCGYAERDQSASRPV